LLLPEILARLRTSDTRWILSIAGEGSSSKRSERVRPSWDLKSGRELLGYVPSGPLGALAFP
jgi:hypothetical protein